MMLGYAIIAIPTGIVTAELTKEREEQKFHHQKRVGECSSCGLEKRVGECSSCGLDIYDPNANYCRNCGKPLPIEKTVLPGRQSADE